MFDFTRHFRGLGIAVAVLALSAGAVFAGQAALSAPATSPVAAEQTPDADRRRVRLSPVSGCGS